eukprot:581736-Prymnesium_polylepis.1
MAAPSENKSGWPPTLGRAPRISPPRWRMEDGDWTTAASWAGLGRTVRSPRSWPTGRPKWTPCASR